MITNKISEWNSAPDFREESIKQSPKDCKINKYKVALDGRQSLSYLWQLVRLLPETSFFL